MAVLFKLFGFILYTVVGIIVFGLIVGYLYPGPVTGAILPTGLLLWWMLYEIDWYFLGGKDHV
jgi:hypothetical protein